MKGWAEWTGVVAVAAALAACGTQRPAPVVDRSGSTPARVEKPAAPSAAPGARSAKDGIYTVQRGDTLYSIAMAFGVDMRDLANWNSLGDSAALVVGQQLRITPPAASAATVTPVAPSGVAEVRPLPLPGAEAGGASAAPPQTGPVPTVPADKAEPAKPAPAESTVPWQWPAPGKVIENFDETRNKGIDIAGNDGDPVTAAADGEVVYVGSALRGYGNLVIVKHNEEFISAYAHNRQILVKQGQAVKRGQRIAEFS